jgi:hypothetical protein
MDCFLYARELRRGCRTERCSTIASWYEVQNSTGRARSAQFPNGPDTDPLGPQKAIVCAPAIGKEGKRVPTIFFRTEAGGEPVEFGWPIGMPGCRPLPDGIFEARTHLTRNRIARVRF